MPHLARVSTDEKVHVHYMDRPIWPWNLIHWVTGRVYLLSQRGNQPAYEALHDANSTTPRPESTSGSGYYDDHTATFRGLITTRGFNLLAGLYSSATIFYFLSLRGAKSPQEMNSRLGILGICLVASVACLSAQLWFSMLILNTTPRLRRLNALLLVVTPGLWYALDNGNQLDSHGAFNLLIFCVIFIPINALIGLLCCWYTCTSVKREERPRRFFLQLLGTALAGALVVFVVAQDKEHNLMYGYLGKQISCTPEERITGTCHSCQWKSAIPWFDLLPIRVNGFTGPMTCPTEEFMKASFDDNGTLSIDCPKQLTEARSWFNNSVLQKHSGAIYAKLPRTETWGLSLKKDALENDFNPLQEHVLSFAERNLFPYKHPVQITDNTDTLLVLCGSAKPRILNRILPINGTSSNALIPPKTTPVPTQNPKLNVVTLFIDAVSRRQLHRRLPETGRVLESTATATNGTSELFEFFRYHTVGLNTGPNTRALWAGLDENDPDASGTPIWEQYQSSGYVSARIDPMCQDWTAYYNPHHFVDRTSTLITEPRLSHEYLTWSCFPPYLPVGKQNNGNFAGPTSIKARCISGTHVGWHELDWSSRFISSYRRSGSRPFYLNAAFMEGHEGSSEVLRTLDSRLARFLDPTTSPMDLNMTAIIILSDHGALMGLNNAFFQNGKIEAANPAAIMLLPRWFTVRTERGSNLREATQRLITAHDLHETMKEFMDSAADSSENVARQAIPEAKKARGYNLFRQLVPDRDCAQAGISLEACKCV